MSTAGCGIAAQDDDSGSDVSEAAEEEDDSERPEPGGAPKCPALKTWFPECWVATHARIAVGNDRTFYWTPFTSEKWGNALSGYWQARALALLAGYGFDSYVGFQGSSWLAKLPQKVPPTTCPDIPKFKSACDSCDAEAWEFAHRCSGPWTGIRDVVRNDTQAAVRAWAEEAGQKLPEFGPGDVVIQARCSEDTMLRHPEYGPVAFSFYTDNIDLAVTKRILLVSETSPRDELCRRVNGAREEHLRRKLPGVEVEASGSNRGHDFARLLLAPVLFRDSQSSFGLWAGAANRGQVFSVPLLREFTNNTKPDLGEDWHWVDAPVLYPRVAEEEGITLKEPDKIIQWLQTH